MERDTEMRNKGKIMLCVFALVLLIGIGILSLPIRQTITPEFLCAFPQETNYQEKRTSLISETVDQTRHIRMTLWFPVSEKPYTEASESRLREIIGDDFLLDFQQYTYIISLGYTVRAIYKVEYLISEMSPTGNDRFGEAFADLSSNCSGNQAYLYRIPKDWIDIKYYDRFDGNYCIID